MGRSAPRPGACIVSGFFCLIALVIVCILVMPFAMHYVSGAVDAELPTAEAVLPAAGLARFFYLLGFRAEKRRLARVSDSRQPAADYSPGSRVDPAIAERFAQSCSAPCPAGSPMRLLVDL
jgi:hypothetical protein